ncbi:hypothetical protein SEA_ZEINA_7 [Arthrobacter phage Zeina]|nr:hypothetical protein SEA_ZEINA_7 [Arthrobacter phage Zeina]
MGRPTDEFLAHFGVKGMKWGKHKAQAEPEPAKPRVPASEDAVTYRSAQAKIAGGGTDALSDRELKKVVERMNMEAQYQRLTTPQEKTSSGKRLAEDILSNVAPIAFASVGAHMPSAPRPEMGSDLMPYSKKRVAGSIAKDVATQIIKDYGMQIVGELVKSAVLK